ncbi:DEAD/DEAH box helicase family protein [Methanolobus sp.]|uniref:DEAD/DEAH box helicase family protein n=1 Tax=Methanolobus sp. TaxID=1874737 RepID=UPI0025ECE746|nr:DEAD/DEAH box helicase family protein [Methanolobus sp.]
MPAPKKSNNKKHERLEKYLMLNRYINSLFGMEDFDKFKDKLSDVDEGYDEEGRSWMFHTLISLSAINPILKSKMEIYDSNIKSYVNHINHGHPMPIRLKYFQYLAVLFTDIYFDKYFSNQIGLMNEINEFVIQQMDDYDFLFTKDDLSKIAFWMATGSGKTLLLHINYLQFIKYNKGPNRIELDNVLLVTPNESLSDQHIEEMNKSSIPCEIFQLQNNGYFAPYSDRNVVKVIDIHKLTEEKTGQGVTVDVENFGSKNLVFVDEGHKGSGGKKWKYFREELAKEGFAIEYSATFGQAVAASNGKDSNELRLKYGKSIIFDYSYRYFYNDGFGKDYRIFNLKDTKISQPTKLTLMIANLLTLYEQKLVFDRHPQGVQEYNIENPLWIFVGSKVQGAKNQSDILEVVKFVNLYLKNEGKWAIEIISRILDGNSGLIDKNDRDLFSPSYPERRLEYLRKIYTKADELYANILKDIFHNANSAPLYLVNIKNASGEIALRCGSGDYFGLINIGDDTSFLKLVESETDILTEKDEVGSSIFDQINERKSKIYLLIGAKKFIEGWNSWRVSNMGLLNIGKSEGTQIIQLFGRGVRLKGKDHTLKRSRSIDDYPPADLPLLETLNIFGIEANYMDYFKDYLEAEGMKTENYIEHPIKIKINESFLNEKLFVPDVEKKRFKDELLFELCYDEQINPVEVDFSPKIEVIESQNDGGISATTGNRTRVIEGEYLNILDWSRIYFEILDFKMEKGWSNLVFSKGVLKEIMEKGKNVYSLKCPDYYVEPKKYEDLWQIEEITISILKKYILKYYNRNRSKWTKNNLDVAELQDSHGNFEFKEFKVIINEVETDLIDRIQSINIEELLIGETDSLVNNVYFDRHFYQPLLTKKLEKSTKYSLQPTGLNSGEKQFIQDLRSYVESCPDALKGVKIFVLRNQPKKGIGFFVETLNYYPDFVIWIKKDSKQHIIFVDPKGLTKMGMTKGFSDEKVMLHKNIKELSTLLTKRLKDKSDDREISLCSFIVSWTPYRDVKPIFGASNISTFESHNIFFQDDKGYVGKLIERALNE